MSWTYSIYMYIYILYQNMNTHRNRIGHWKKIPNWSYSLDDGQFHPIPHPSHSRMVVYNVYIFTLYIMYIHIIFSLYRYYIYIYILIYDICIYYLLYTIYAFTFASFHFSTERRVVAYPIQRNLMPWFCCKNEQKRMMDTAFSILHVYPMRKLKRPHLNWL